MEQFWKDTMNCLLGVVLYHGQLPDEESWCEQYKCEINNMILDIKDFYNANKFAHNQISNESMASFLVYTENEHIGNKHFITKCEVDKSQLFMIASKIINELN